MTGVICAIIGTGGTAGLDVQNMVVGTSGTAISQDRVRGYLSGSQGTLSPGTSSIYGGAAITQLAWFENTGFPFYVLTITGATDSGWTTMNIGGTLTLSRASRTTYSAGSWTWSTTDNVTTQAFGAAGSARTIIFN